MKSKGFPLIALPLILAIGLLSMGDARNLNMQRYLAEKALSLHLVFSKHIEKKAPKNTFAKLETWLHTKKREAHFAHMKAASFAPFQITSEKNIPYQVATVIYRADNSYNSSLWINKGSDDNIQRNSPVLNGDALIGIVDYVGKKTSSVRLITDSSLTPSVRVARGVKDLTLDAAVRQIINTVNASDGRFNEEETKALTYLLRKVEKENKAPQGAQFLAKGIVQGNGSGKKLKGLGFNYNYSDKYGPSRDLRTGTTTDTDSEKVPLLQTGDLLITSGMDGVFCEGLKVAYVEQVLPLPEGAFAYECLARPCAEDIQDVQYVTILEPSGFDESLIPTRLERTKQLLEQ